jgi:hypothetical protein
MAVVLADAHAHVQILVSVVKMTTMLEVYTTEKQSSVVRFFFNCRRKVSMQNDIPEEMFHIYSGKCLSRKSVQNWF